MGMTEDFEASLQVLRGWDTDITLEVNEIKVLAEFLFFISVLLSIGIFVLSYLISSDVAHKGV